MVKDILREIKARKLQFMAILLITTLGVGFFIGIRVTGHDMRLTADAYMESSNVLDLQVMHTMAIDADMIDDINDTLEAEGLVADFNTVYALSDKFDNVISLYDYNSATQDDITLLEGKLPHNKNEALIDSLLVDLFDLQIGDKITIKTNDVFKNSELTIVGIGQSSLYLNKSRGYTTLGSGEVSGFVYAYDLEKKIEDYTALRYRFSEDVNIIKQKKALEAASDEISAARKARLVAPEIEKIEKAKVELEIEKEKAKAQIAANEAELVAAKADLAVAKSQLEAGLDELTFGIPTSGTLDERLDLVKRGFATVRGLMEDSIKSLETRIENIDNPIVEEVLKDELATQVAELNSMINQFNTGYAQLEAGIAEYNRGVSEVEAGEIELAAAKEQLANEMDKAAKQLEAALAEIEAADSGDLIIFERKDAIIGYTDFYNDSERIEAIGAVFPLIFFGVAILVTLSTITQMVEESRMQLGVYKALGFTSFQASLKYVGFAFIAWALGVFFGVIIGFFLIPNIIYNAYRILYETPQLVSNVVLNYLWVPLIISLVSSVGIAFIRSNRVSRENAANLLRPPLPKGGQRILLERFTLLWNRLSFLYKVSFRNLFRNKARFLMTIIGIGGCSGLLITGFGISNSVNSVIDKQFNDIFKYDGFVVYEESVDFDDDMFSSYIDVYSSNIVIDDQDASLYVSDNLEDFSNYFAFNNKGSNEEIIVDENFTIISEKLALLNNLKVGDDISFTYDNKKYSTEVSAIIENYANHYMFMSENLFEDLLTTEVTTNMRFFKADKVDDSFIAKILEDDKVLNVTSANNLEKIFKDQMGNFDIIIYVVVGAAFLLELIVLLNLITMNMSERKKELATLKVLGFYPNELATYILRENIILTFISLGFGVVFGIFLHRFVVITAELDMIMFYRKLDLMSIVKSLILTLIISYLINYVMSRRANRVDMSEALKTFDA